MQLNDFDYELPTELIAQRPLETRSSSRLMLLSRARQTITHHQFVELPAMLREGDLLAVYPGEDYAPQDNDPMDYEGHGTNVAGCMTAITNNGVGIAKNDLERVFERNFSVKPEGASGIGLHWCASIEDSRSTIYDFQHN